LCVCIILSTLFLTSNKCQVNEDVGAVSVWNEKRDEKHCVCCVEHGVVRCFPMTRTLHAQAAVIADVRLFRHCQRCRPRVNSSSSSSSCEIDCQLVTVLRRVQPAVHHVSRVDLSLSQPAHDIITQRTLSGTLHTPKLDVHIVNK